VLTQAGIVDAGENEPNEEGLKACSQIFLVNKEEQGRGLINDAGVCDTEV
jgi:hypothetical protein